MKRFLICVMALVLLTATPLTVLAEETFTIDVMMLYMMRTVTPMEICASAEASGALAACAFVDLGTKFNQTMSDHIQYALDHNLVYIGRSGYLLKVFFWAKPGLVVLSYANGTLQADVTVLRGDSNASKDYVEYMMRFMYLEGVMDTYYHIDKVYIEDYLDYIYGRN